MQGRNYAHLMRFDIAEMKKWGPLPVLMEWLGAGQHAKKSAWCPFHDNTKDRAFSIYETHKGWKWKCHSRCGSGDELDFIEKYEQRNRQEALERYSQLTGVHGASYCAPVKAQEPRAALVFPTDFHKGSRDELQTVAILRKVGFWGVATMQQNGVLGFGTVCGVPCWIATDGARHCAEARRMDGASFPEVGTLGARKVHTIKGSVKSWPVGLGIDRDILKHFKKCLLLEGSGDLVAGYHYAEPVGDWLPVTILGAGVTKLHPEALALLRGKRLRIVSHVDPAGVGAREKMGRELKRAGAEVDWFDLEGLRKADGSPIKDLNDCTDIHAEDADEMGGLLK
jgi:hypothetical protein